MSSSSSPSNQRLIRLAQVAGVLLLFMVLIALSATQYYVSNVANGFEPQWWNMVWLALPEWVLWAALVPLVYWLSQRFLITREQWATYIGIHLGFSVLIAAVHVVGTTALTIAFSLWNRPFLDVLASFAGVRMHYDVVVYWAVVGAGWAYTYYKQNRQRALEALQYEAEAAQLAAQLSEARLQALTMQLQPHFLFNTLHAISASVHTAPDRAEHMLALLSDLLRRTLESDDASEIPLVEELDLLRQYLAIEKVRFQDRLTIQYEVDDTLMDVLVPPFILQPLVENAVRHGIMQRPGPGQITVSAQQEAEQVLLRVQDDGIGLSVRAPAKRRGIGLRNTEARLQQLYGTAYQLDLQPNESEGVTALIAIPYREADRGVIARVAHAEMGG